jgi:hypothetical protein
MPTITLFEACSYTNPRTRSQRRSKRALGSQFALSSAQLMVRLACSNQESQKVSIVMNHSFQIAFEVESKYFGTVTYLSTEEKKVDQNVYW